MTLSIFLVVGAAGEAAGQATAPTHGVYVLADGSVILIGEGPTPEHALAVFPGEQIRELTWRPAPDPGGWTYGPTLATADPVQGTLRALGPAANGATGIIDWSLAGGVEERRASLRNLSTQRLEFRSGALRLRGTLTLPEGEGPFPTVVLAHGSGDEARDRGPRVYGFVARGHAVFTYDKRGVGESEGNWSTASLQELAQDLAAAVEALRDNPRIDAKRLGVWGHSQGAWVTVIAAAKTPHIAFLIAECGGGVSPMEQELFRGGNLLRLKLKLPEEQIAAVERFRRLKFRVAAGLEPRSRFTAELVKVQGEPWFHTTGDKIPDGFWPRNGAYDPGPALRALTQPSLFLLARHDISTPLDATRSALESALAASLSRHSIVVLESAGHELFHATEMTLPDQLGQTTRLATHYLETLFRWLDETTGSREPGGVGSGDPATPLAEP